MGKSTKISHEDLQRDEVAESVGDMIAWVEKNRSRLIALVILIVVAAIGWSMYSRHEASVIRDSNALLAQALNDYQRLSFTTDETQAKAAVTALVGNLDTLIKEYGNTDIGVEALFLKGAAYYSQDQFKEAREAYTAYRDKARNDDEVARAYIALGYTDENESFFTEPANQRNLLDQALANYEAAATRAGNKSYLHFYALMGEARIYELTLRDEEAITRYQQVINERPAPDSSDKTYEKSTGISGPLGEMIDKMLGDQEKLLSFQATARQRLERLQATMGAQTGSTVIEGTAGEAAPKAEGAATPAPATATPATPAPATAAEAPAQP